MVQKRNLVGKKQQLERKGRFKNNNKTPVKKPNIITTGCTNDAILTTSNHNGARKNKSNKIVKSNKSNKSNFDAKTKKEVIQKEKGGTKAVATTVREPQSERNVKNNGNNDKKFKKSEKTGFAKKRKRVGVNPEDPNAVFVMNLPVNAVKEDIVKAFKHVGNVAEVAFIKKDGLATGNGFIKFSTSSDKENVLAIEKAARSKLGAAVDQESVSFGGVGFSIDGRLLKVKDSVKKDELIKDLAERKVIKRSRRLDLLTVGEVELHDPLLKKFTKGFIDKYRNNYKSKRQKVQDVNVHISETRVRVGNAPKDLTKVMVKNTIVSLLLSTDEGKALLNTHALTIIKKGKTVPEKGEGVTKEEKTSPTPRKKIGVQLLAFKSMGTVLIVHETRTSKEQKHDAAQRHKFVKGRFTGTVFIDFYCHEIAKYVIEQLAFRQKIFSPTQERPLLVEFALEDKRKAEIHKLKKTKRDGLTKSKMKGNGFKGGDNFKKKK